MDFRLKRGQRCVIRLDDRETEAVKIAAANLVKDLECTLNIVAQISFTVNGCDENDSNKEGAAEVLVGTFHVSGQFDEFTDVSDLFLGLYDEAGCLRKEEIGRAHV